eukprot:CAMPEP_0115736476 /NCGR_PEP_ID=MMETSP0272-20121206/87283_1 /TAXON_ID=71861 /ORGANISM="Scrippsiella trochoidea, Strain CCMP3099" /LENGTH=84 /DNA_ID=CAMNT_0003180671 /DNA_START=31 /DNA_END=282 /DNA_ORIENTATION=-
MMEGAPYCVVSHRRWCPGCRRDVDEEETVMNPEDEPVHAGCGWVCLESGFDEGLPGSGRCSGPDLALLHGAPGSEAAWIAEQKK